MINKLSIKNFKSIKELDIDCAKVNLFIGEPNTGKSNILEALGLLSWMGHRANTPLNEYVRFQGIQNLFFDEIVENPVKIDLFPNPADQKIVVDVSLTDAEAFRVVIYNYYGTLEIEKDLGIINGPVSEDIDVSELLSGIHLIRIYTGNSITSKSLVKL